MLPSSSLFTTSASTILTNSLSRSRSSSAAILPVKFGSANPSTSICTGPMAIVALLSAHEAESSFCFCMSNSACVRTPSSSSFFRFVELGDHVVAPDRRRRWSRLRRTAAAAGRTAAAPAGPGGLRSAGSATALRRWFCCALLAGVVRDPADDGCACEWPSSQSHLWCLLPWSTTVHGYLPSAYSIRRCQERLARIVR